MSIGTNGWWLSDLTLEGVDSPKGEIQVQLLGTGGAQEALYKLFKNSKASGFTTDGWYVGTTKNIVVAKSENDHFFKAGEGCWLKGVASAKIASSGEVITEDCPVELAAGKKMIINPFPAKTYLSNIEVLGLASSPKGADVQIQFLGTGGGQTALYKYFKGSTASGFTTDGWYIGTTKNRVTTENDVEIPVGFGMWVKGINGAKLNFKKPF